MIEETARSEFIRQWHDIRQRLDTIEELERLKYSTAVRTVNTSAQIADSDGTIFADTSGGAIALALPLPSSGRLFIVKDSTGNASANNITISGGTIDGSASYVININYGFVRLQNDGNNWFSV